MTDRHLSREERAEMFRAHIGLVTALIDDDQAAVTEQLKSITQEQGEASHGDVAAFAGRMAKQVEAGARVTRHLLMSLAPRLGLTEAQANQMFAEIYSGTDIADAMEE